MKLKVRYIGSGVSDPASTTMFGEVYHLNAKAREVEVTDFVGRKLMGNSHFEAEPVAVESIDTGSADAKDEA